MQNEKNKPLWLVHENLEDVERLDHEHYLQVATKLSIKQQKLLHCFVVYEDKSVKEIVGLKDLGNYNSQFRFEFFNPMRKIQIEFRDVKEFGLKDKILSLIDSYIENNANY